MAETDKLVAILRLNSAEKAKLMNLARKRRLDPIEMVRRLVIDGGR